MNKRLGRLLGVTFLLFTAVVAGCTAMQRMPVADQVMVHAEGSDLETLRKGRTLVVTECVGCHRAYWPGEFSPRQWGDIAPNMSQRANLTTPQSKSLRSYLMAASRTEAAAR